MNQALKRIEEALNQLETQKNTVNPQPDTTKPSYSFDIFLSPKSDFPEPWVSDSSKQTPKAATPVLPRLNTASQTCPPAEETIEISSLTQIIKDTDDTIRAGEQRSRGAEGQKGTQENLLQNLKSKSQNFPTLSHEEAIEQVVLQIQDLYHEGPIVDGYLEYFPPAPDQDNPDEPILKEVCFERVIDPFEVSNLTSGQEIDLLGGSYRLCGIDAGQQWSYPCPLDQLPSVSMAIARYQKLQQLLQRKHELEQNKNKG